MKTARWIASGLGSGFLPRAPGTWGSLLALLPGAALLAWSPWALLAGVVLATVSGLWAIPRAGGSGDPGWVVIDEVAGMWLAIVPLAHPSLPGLAVAFAAFRLFDIAKPGVIGAIDRMPGAAGVMGDDLAAGVAAAMVVWALAG